MTPHDYVQIVLLQELTQHIHSKHVGNSSFIGGIAYDRRIGIGPENMVPVVVRLLPTIEKELHDLGAVLAIEDERLEDVLLTRHIANVDRSHVTLRSYVLDFFVEIHEVSVVQEGLTRRTSLGRHRDTFLARVHSASRVL